MTLPPFLTRPPGRMLAWFWAGILGVGAAGATTLQVLGPPAPAAPVTAPPVAAASTPAQTSASDATPLSAPIAIPSAPGSLWPATNPALAGGPSAASTPSRPAEPARHPAAPRQVRITVVPPMPPDQHHLHAPGPRLYAKVELRAPHHNPTHERVVTYAYAEPRIEDAGGPSYYGYEPGYAPQPGYGWQQYPGPRSYGPRGQYYAYYPSY
jgi:hypothetical protein